MSIIHILSEEMVDSLVVDLADLALSDDPTVSREAKRLRTLIEGSSRENGGPTAISNKEYEALLALLGEEEQP